MMRSLFSGVSGLKNHQTRMDVIGNNISNVNTTGFKSSRVTFNDMLSQNLTGAAAPSENRGGTNPKQIGLGSTVASVDLMFTNGSVQSTGKNTDLCISGSGLFVVKDNSGTYYTRNGAFEFDADGNYVLPGSGLFVQGWMARDGKLSTTGETGNITIPAGKSMESEATKTATYTNNLNGDPEGYDISNIMVTYIDGTTETLSSYSPTNLDGATITIHTDKGNTYTLDASKGGTYYIGQTLNNTNLMYTSKIDTVTANSTGTVALTVTNKDSQGNDLYVSVTPAGSGIKGLNTGSYTVGGNYSVTQPITAVSANNKTKEVTLTLGTPNPPDGSDGFATVVIPMPTSSPMYQVGDMFTTTVPITSITANAGAVVNLENGKKETLTSNLSITQAKQSYDVYAVTGEKIDGIQRNDKVSSVILNTTDGRSVSGLAGQNYSAGDTFYPAVVTTATAYDSLGGSHDVPVLFTKTGENTWTVSLNDGKDEYIIHESDGTETKVKLTSKELKFNSSGGYVDGDGTLEFTYQNGAAPQKVNINLGGLTQYIGSSTINAKSDGHAAGTLSSISIDTSGVITGTYTNGVKLAEAQVAVAQFNNASGLTKTGDSLYQESNNSGTANVKTASDLGVTLTPSSLEMSNVDVANEFTDMIITQRGFQSNSKIITVSDEMLETLINMKR